MMKKSITPLLTLALIVGSQFSQAQVVITNDSTYKTAEQMFLANELFESGEPFAEEIGYNLDLLDPDVLNMPDSIAYTTGIENYEYSRYLLNTLNGRSGLGLHVMWSPVIKENAAMQDSSFDGKFTGGMKNGYKEDDMMMMMIGNFGKNANQTPPAHAFPQFADFMGGSTHLPQTVAANFQMDYASTRWDRSKMDKILNLGSMGQSLQKQYWWAQDMLSTFHDGNEDEVVPTGKNSPDSVGSPNFDPSNNIYYGGNNVDGFIGQVLTAVSINKTKLLISKLAYDGTTLGGVNPATYDPAKGIQYFPTKIAVTETPVMTGLPPEGTTFSVTDKTSQLFDQWAYLGATVSYKNMMNPADTSDEAHLAYQEVFDGYPFPAASIKTGKSGPYDLMMGTSKVIFLNIMAMHYNSAEKTFVDESSLDAGGKAVMGKTIGAVNAAYMVFTLAHFSEEFAGTPLATMADNALLEQANYILAKFKDASGGFYNSYTIGTGASKDTKTLADNAAIVRGLYAAYSATNNAAFLTAANDGYNYLINNFYDAGKQVFRSELGENKVTYTPWNLALLSGAMREATLVGKQKDAVKIYTRVFKTVYNRMLLTEAEATGETGADSDKDGIGYIAGQKLPFVFAAEGTIQLTTGVQQLDADAVSISIFPNPAQKNVTVSLNVENASELLVSIYNLNGSLVASNTSSSLVSGSQQVNVNIESLKSGNYIIRTSVDGELLAIKKLVVAK